METIVKVSLTIEIEGCTRHSLGKQKVCKTIPFFNKKTKKKEYRKIYFKDNIIEVLPAYQHLNIYQEAYEEMVSKNNPYKVPLHVWKKWNEKQRLEFHFQDICDSLQGKSYSYEIINN